MKVKWSLEIGQWEQNEGVKSLDRQKIQRYTLNTDNRHTKMRRHNDKKKSTPKYIRREGENFNNVCWMVVNLGHFSD